MKNLAEASNYCDRLLSLPHDELCIGSREHGSDDILIRTVDLFATKKVLQEPAKERNVPDEFEC